MRTILIVLAPLALGCGSDDQPPPIVDPPSLDCPPGEWLSESAGCAPAGLPPDLPCPPGEWLDGDGTCLPAGVPHDGCGEGFLHDGDRGCEPILPDTPCPPGLMAVPGETLCRDVAPCGAGKWGDIPVESNTEYVDPSYAGMDGDGSALKPWTSIQSAVVAAAEGAIVALAAGSYVEDLNLAKRVRLWGVCPSLVELVGTGAAIEMFAGASGAELHDLAVRGGIRGVLIFGSLDVMLERLWVHDNAAHGVGVRSYPGPARITLSGSLVELNGDTGVAVQGADATVEASVVRATQPDAQGLFGRGVGAQPESTSGAPAMLFLRGSLIEHNHDRGVFVQGSEASVEESVIRATQPNMQAVGGRGLEVTTTDADGAPSTVLLRTSFLEENQESGVFVQGSQLTVEASVVRTTQPAAQGLGGRGIGAQSDPATGVPSTLVLRTSLVDRNHEVGLFVGRSDATVEASVVRATEPDAEGLLGHGLQVVAAPTGGAPSTLLLRTSLIAQNHDFGVAVSGSHATLEASVIRATEPDAYGEHGRGVAAQVDPATATPSLLVVRASLLEQNHEVGLIVSGSEAHIEESVVRATALNTQGFAGYGVMAQWGTTDAPSTLFLERSLIEQSYGGGVVILGADATIHACVVRDTQPNMGGFHGSGIIVVSDQIPTTAAITATRIDQSALAGVAAWGAHVTIGSSALRCQAFDLDYENHRGLAALFEDLGGNLCGCPEATAKCKAVSANLEPPPSLSE